MVKAPAFAPDSIAAVSERLDALTARVALVEARAARAGRAVADHPIDRAALRLLATIAEAAAGRAFTAKMIAEHADRLGGDLRDVLITSELSSPRKIGKFLKRHCGAIVGGVQLARVGEDRDGVIWCFCICGSEPAGNPRNPL